ncbi:MAG: hypothetical protein WC538_21190 [Thermoanaerobaculia bacterium]|jgi:hypothetical protein
MQRVLTSFEDRRVTSLGTNGVQQSDSVEALTDWFPAVGLDEAKAIVYAGQNVGAMTCDFTVQTAVLRTDAPDAWSATLFSFGNVAFQSCTSEVSLTGVLTNKMWARFGVLYRKSTTGTYAQADLGGQVSFVSRGMLVGQMPTTMLYANTWVNGNPGGWATRWSTDWVSAEWCDKVRAAIELGHDVTGTPEVRFVYQTATYRTSNPDSNWAAVGASTWTAGGTGYTGDVSLSLSGKMWVRFGVQIRSTDAPASGTLDGVSVTAAVGVRRT